jgi:ergothioneine biosynthesis protein EgtB
MPRALILEPNRLSLATRMAAGREATDELFSILRPDALYERPIPERHRLVFYLGHLEAFDWNLIAVRAFGIEPFHPEFDRLFAFGIDPVDGGLPSEPASDWPDAASVRSYNARVREVLDECLSGARAPREGTDLDTIFNMAIEHRLMHAETLAYLFHQLPAGAKIAPPDIPLPSREGTSPREIAIPAGEATLGQSREDHAFGWDNEFDRMLERVPAFTIDSHKVTNGRFLEFVRDGGYDKEKLWSPADWKWRVKSDVRHPGFWRERDGSWLYRGMFAEVPLPLDAPVYVSHAEASAFARWVDRSLPTEAQFHRAAYETPDGEERDYPWGAEPPSERHGNFDLHRWDPTPVGSFPAGDSAFGAAELVGNGWEWTSSVFGPFPGFTPHPDYEGYSKNFFDGEHYVQKGGSPRTAACMLRRSFRNWFQPHYPYVYAAFRTVGRGD